MTETQALLSKIAGLRQRLQQAQGLVQDADVVAAALVKQGDFTSAVRAKVEASSRQQALVDSALRQLPGAAKAAGDGATLPTQLTSRASRVLRRAHELLSQLRAIADNSRPPGNGDLLAQIYRESVSITDTVVRAVQTLPPAPSAQVRSCEGLEAVLNIVNDRLATIAMTLKLQRREAELCGSLADMLTDLANDRDVDFKGLVAIAEGIQEEAALGAPLYFPAMTLENVAQYIAGHSLAVARVMARLSRNDPEWRAKPLEPMLAALIHDAGMVKLPATLLGHKGPLTDEQRRTIESHPILGAEMATRIKPAAGWLVEAAGQHHERLDGTGYPGGLRDKQIKPLIRLLSVCDVYAAMCQPRPHRPVQDTRTALTDTLLWAEKGGLDPSRAERLLQLTFYPVGSAVELSDGTTAVVVATHKGARDQVMPSRPVVAVLADAEGQLLATPGYVDLAEIDGLSIVRGLTVEERLDRLGRRYPHLAR